MLPPRATFHGLDLRVIEVQVKAADQLPDQTCAMIFVDQLFDIDAAQHKLLSIDRDKSRFSGQPLVAHIRSLPTLANFAMTLLDRATISSQLPDGESPYGGVILDTAGNLYGTTYKGGASNYGTVFKVSKAGKETVLHSFAGGSADGCNPGGGLILDAKGNLYGDTQLCGASNYGTVFKVSKAGKETVPHSFAGGSSDGAEPFYGSLLMDKKGNLYGVTEHGGTGEGCNLNCGVLYRLSKSGTLTVLHSFANAPDGSFPFGTPVMDGKGNLFGTTDAGDPDQVGIVWKVSKNEHETILHSFTPGGVDGVNPAYSLVLDSAGNVYGTTESGGSSNQGVVFEITP